MKAVLLFALLFVFLGFVLIPNNGLETDEVLFAQPLHGLINPPFARAALLAAILLATDPTFLLPDTFDWGPLALQHLLVVSGCLLIASGRLSWGVLEVFRVQRAPSGPAK